MMKKTAVSGEKGQSAVEMALVAGVFLLILIGIFDIGRAVWYFTTMENAAREATRYALVHGSLSSDPIVPGDSAPLAAVVDRYAAAGMNTSDLKVNASWPDGSNAPGSRVTITASYPFRPVFNIGLFDFTISASSTRNIVR